MTEASLREEFEGFYRRKWRTTSGYWLDYYPRYLAMYARMLEVRNAEIRRRVEPRRAGLLIDIGCGIGDVIAAVSDVVSFTVGLDLATVNVERAKENIERDRLAAEAAVASATALPLRREVAGVVVLADVIEHIPDRDAAFREAYRLLTVGGALIVITPDSSFAERVERADQVAWRIARRLRLANPASDAAGQGGVFETFLSRQQLLTEVTRAGFDIEEYSRICFYPGPEGGGAFSGVLARLGRRERALLAAEALLRPTFGAVERLKVFNQKQIVVAVKRRAAGEDHPLGARYGTPRSQANGPL